jgi:hypothetical protein
MSWWVIPLCIIGVLMITVIIRMSWKTSHCPDCGRKLGPVKENQNGWLYRECLNSECNTQAIGYEALCQR